MTTANLLENKGRLLLELEEFFKAELIFRDVYKIREELIHKNHPDIAEVLNYLALSLIFQNKLDDAILVHNQVLTMMASVIAITQDKYQNELEVQYCKEQEHMKLKVYN